MLKRGFIYIFSGLLVVLVTGYIAACSSMGERPNDEHKAQFAASNNYDSSRQQFINEHQERVDSMWNPSRVLEALKKNLAKTNSTPTQQLPQQQPDFSALLSGANALKVVWFGHSSFLLNIDGKTVLIDPVFANAAPLSFLVPRFQDAVVQAKDLPPIDYIVISHDHYDHLEKDTMAYFANKPTQFIVPLGISAYLKGWGVKAEQIHEQDWWQSIEFNGIQFTATPSQHFSGRHGLGGNHTLWASWVIKSANHNVYFSGDTGYHEQFAQIGEKYGPFDVAFMENGQYNESWKAVHMLPEQGIKAFKQLNAKQYFPIHWGMFDLSVHQWNEPIKTIDKLTQAHNIALVAPTIGAVIDLEKTNPIQRWWQ